MSVLNDVLTGVGGDQGLASGAADIIGAIKGTPKSVSYVTNEAPKASMPSYVLIGGALLAVVVLVMVLKQ